MSQPLLSKLPGWEGYKKDIFTVIGDALIILRNQPNLPVIEDSTTQHSLNRQLAKDCFKKAAHRNNLPHHMPTYNGDSPPYKDDQNRQPRESKKPDFYWQLVDSTADENSCERRFVVECKRLGDAPSPNWKLNENYVKHGIRRFVTSPHEYGKGDDACGMIGYVQSMELDDILHKVNTATASNLEPITQLQLSAEGWQENGISELEHELTRQFPIKSFRLYHFWVDLRRDK